MSPEKTSTVEPSLFKRSEGCQGRTLANPARSGRGQWEVQYGVTNYAPTGTNSYASITSLRYETGLAYDPDGNMTQDSTWYDSYDGENRLTQMQRKDGTQTLQFAYDYLGRRVKKTVRSGGPTGAVASSTKFVWAGWKLAAELDAGTGETGSTLAKTYLWGPDSSGGAGAGGLLAVQQGGATYLPVYDPMGNVTGYLDGSSGAVAAAYEYTGYGMMRNQSGATGSFAFGYATQYTDRESGLVYYGLRYYNVTHGRFINRDPIEEQGGVNLYAFVGNNPVNRWDLLGLTGDDKEPPVVLEKMTVESTRSSFPSSVVLEDGYHLDHWGQTFLVGRTFSATIAPPTIQASKAAPNKPWQPNKTDCDALRSQYSELFKEGSEKFASPLQAFLAATIDAGAFSASSGSEAINLVFQRENGSYGYVFSNASNPTDPSSAYIDYRALPQGSTLLAATHGHNIGAINYAAGVQAQYRNADLAQAMSDYPRLGELFSYSDMNVPFSGPRPTTVGVFTPSGDIRGYSSKVYGPPSRGDMAPGYRLPGAPSQADALKISACKSKGL